MNKLEQAARQALGALEETTALCINYESVEEKDGYQFTEAPDVISQGEKAITALREALDGQAECKECGAKQAQIDRLMLEYCPDEMTNEQMQEWGDNQRPAEQAEQEPVGVVTKESLDGVVKWNGWIPREGTKLYAAPVDSKAIRAEALEEAAKVCEQGTGDAVQTDVLKALWKERERIAEAIRGLK